MPNYLTHHKPSFLHPVCMTSPCFMKRMGKIERYIWITFWYCRWYSVSWTVVAAVSDYVLVFGTFAAVVVVVVGGGGGGTSAIAVVRVHSAIVVVRGVVSPVVIIVVVTVVVAVAIRIFFAVKYPTIFLRYLGKLSAINGVRHPSSGVPPKVEV